MTEPITHPDWCDLDLCTAPEVRPTDSKGSGRHRSAKLAEAGWPRDEVYLSQAVAPWKCSTFLQFPGLHSISLEYDSPLLQAILMHAEELQREYPLLMETEASKRASHRWQRSGGALTTARHWTQAQRAQALAEAGLTAPVHTTEAGGLLDEDQPATPARGHGQDDVDQADGTGAVSPVVDGYSVGARETAPTEIMHAPYPVGNAVDRHVTRCGLYLRGVATALNAADATCLDCRAALAADASSKWWCVVYESAGRPFMARPVRADSSEEASDHIMTSRLVSEVLNVTGPFETRGGAILYEAAWNEGGGFTGMVGSGEDTAS